MQLRIDSEEPIERVLDVVGALYGVRLRVDADETPEVPVLDEHTQGITKPRHG